MIKIIEEIKHLRPDCGCKQVLSAYLERPNIRGLERTFDINCLTITSWIKKPQACPA